MNRRGFTLVELAIVLVIIGLILGGVLKGKAMIENAKLKRVKNDVNGIVAAVYAYQDKYGFYPGDDPNDRTSDFGATGCDGGNGDGLFNNQKERICAWQEMIGAGLMGGDVSLHDENLVPKRSPFGGRYLLRYANNINGSGKSGNYIYVQNIPTDAIETLDRQYDDGKYNTGDIQSNVDYTQNSNAYADIYWFAF